MASSPVRGGGGGGAGGPMQSWWEGIAKARDRIRALSQILGSLSSLEALQESERPAKGLLEDERVAETILGRLSLPSSGRGDDDLCQWLYDTYQTGDLDLQAVVLRYVPALCGVYLPRVSSNGDESLAGFEAVLLALYTAETKARGGRPLVVNIPDLSQPSLYHAPRVASHASSAHPRVGQLAAPLEPQVAVKATKRACIVSVALDLFCRRIAIMPRKAKIEACHCTQRWAGESCSWSQQVNAEAPFPSIDAVSSPLSGDSERMLDGNHFMGSPSPSSRQASEIEIVGAAGDSFMGNRSPHHRSSPRHHLLQNWVNDTGASPKRGSPSPSRKHAHGDSPLSGGKHSQATPSSFITDDGNANSPNVEAGLGVRIPLPWELLQPLLKLLGHCLLAPMNPQEVRDAASAATRALHFRASHDLIPEAILATRSLMQLDMAARASAKAVSSSVNSTPSKPRKPEILLVSK